MATQWVVSNAHTHTSLEYHKAHDWFYVKWSGHITAEDVVTVAGSYLRLQQLKHCPKLLNDKREVTGDWGEANDWLEFEWLPQVLPTGLQYFAMVLSRDLHDLASAQDLERRLSPYMKVEMFYDLGTAERWLDSFSAHPA